MNPAPEIAFHICFTTCHREDLWQLWRVGIEWYTSVPGLCWY